MIMNTSLHEFFEPILFLTPWTIVHFRVLEFGKKLNYKDKTVETFYGDTN